MFRKICLIFIVCGFAGSSPAQKAWFADGYHGGIYGHYPMWQARFMVEKLTENKDWKINLEIEPETWDTVSVKDLENFKAFQEYYKKVGRFGRIEFVNPTYAQPYCYNISGESIIRQFSYGIAKINEYFPDATFLTYSVEEPCFTSGLPQILTHFGYKYAVLRNPNTCWGGYTSGFGKDLVKWIGPDGTSLTAVPRYACEDLSSESTWQTNSWTNSNKFISTCFENGIKYPIGMTFQDAGWDGGPWHNEYQPTFYTTWTEFIETVSEKTEPVDWHFSLEDIKPGLVWGAQILQKLAQKVRISENRLIMAEKMASLDFLLNKKVWPEKDFAEAWRTLMLAQHHDCWIVPYNGKPGNTWADKVTRWTTASNQIAGEKINSLFKPEENKANRNLNIIRVYNTLGTTRKDIAVISIPKDKATNRLSVFNSQGEIVPSQNTTNTNGMQLLYFEALVPGMGYSTYYLKKENLNSFSKKSVKKLSNGNIKVETDFYTAIFEPSKGGTISSLVDKKHKKRQLVKRGQQLNNLKGYFYRKEKFHEGAENLARISVIDDGELFVKIKVENHIAGNPYFQWITFYKNNPLIDFELHIDWIEQPGIGSYDQSENYNAKSREKAFYNDNYKLHLEFPLNSVGEKLYKNAAFDVCESKLGNTIYSSWDSIKHNVVLNWVDITNSDKKYGVALFSDHTTSYLQTEELPLGLTVQYIGKGLWGRDYITHGPTNIKYSLLPHKGNWEEGQVQNTSNKWNEHLIAHFFDDSSSPEQNSLLEITDRNLEISSVTIQDNSLLVRVYNSSSDNKPKKIVWNCSVEHIEQVDLYGNTTSGIALKKQINGQLTTELSLPQFGFQTFKLTGVTLITER